MPRPQRPSTRALDRTGSAPPRGARQSAEPDDYPDAVDLPLTERRLVPISPPPMLSKDEARDAPPPPAGYRYTIDGRLVPLVDSRLDISAPEAQAVFCQIVEVTGSRQAAMDALGIKSWATVQRQLDKSPVFSELAEAAANRHRDALYQSAYARATHGYLVPVIGGRNKDEIVAWERRYSDTLTALLLKRHFPEFREAVSPKALVQINTGPTVNLPDIRKLPKEKRDALRLLLAPGEPDPSADTEVILTEVVASEPSPSDD